jgi:phage shock protein PspC (stress-responsive transcriptional regulator)
MVNRVIDQLGMPDGSPAEDFSEGNSNATVNTPPFAATKRLYRDPDNRVIGGVCSGLGHYLNIDMVIIRVIFAISLFMGGLGFWAYIIFWIVAPQAMTASQKCEMRGIPVTAENLRKFSSYK